MDSEILAELKQINAQLAHMVALLKSNSGFSKLDTPSPSMPDIASEVQRRIAEARRKAEENINIPQPKLPFLGG